MSFSNISKLYNSMYYSEKDIIAKAVGTGRTVLENNLHCLSVLRNKYSLFAYIVVLIRRLPDEAKRQSMNDEVCSLMDKYVGKIELEKIGFPCEFKKLLKDNTQ